MKIVVFSFNRGDYLENFVNSVRRCVPDYDLIIIDDGSRDDRTVQKLEKLRQEFQVIDAPSNFVGMHGGLYRNMQRALDLLGDSGPVVFAQEDMQFVREIDVSDINAIKSFFEINQDSAFLHPCFLKGMFRKRDKLITKYNRKSNVYFRASNNNNVAEYYADVAIVHCRRLIRSNWRFLEHEQCNERQARSRFQKMGFVRDPFLMYLPDVRCWRGGQQTIWRHIAEGILPAGVNHYEELTKQEIRTLRQRPYEILPVAEDFLSNRWPTKKPFSYDSLSRFPFLARMQDYENRLRNKFSALRSANSSRAK